MIAATSAAPILRRRIEMVKGTGFRTNQPYHAAEEMKLPDAEAFLKRTEKLAVDLAAASIRDALSELSDRYQIKRASVLLASGKPLPELGRILAAHPLIHTAEGVFFREVLKSACERCGLAVSGVRERDVPAGSVARAAGFAKTLGRPWTLDEKFSTAAAWIALEDDH